MVKSPKGQRNLIARLRGNMAGIDFKACQPGRFEQFYRVFRFDYEDVVCNLDFVLADALTEAFKFHGPFGVPPRVAQVLLPDAVGNGSLDGIALQQTGQ